MQAILAQFESGSLHMKEPNAKCGYCSKDIYKKPSRLKSVKSGMVFCSRACKEKAQSLDSDFPSIRPSHYKNGEYTYRRRAFSAKGLICERCGYCKVPAILEVHHKDRNRANNHVDNLLVLCPNCHHEEHYIAGDGRYRR